MSESETTAPDEASASSLESMRYREAIGELRQILDGIEREEVDLDVLSEQVERAAALIHTCRSRIERAEMRVQRVLNDLQPDPEG